MRITIDMNYPGDRVSYHPGLNWNEYSEAVSEAAASLVVAVQKCQDAPHNPEYEERIA